MILKEFKSSWQMKILNISKTTLLYVVMGLLRLLQLALNKYLLFNVDF
ncbi:hypothetical protein AAJ76_500052072 [Vairimorpha ceranae]|uniref:Uncharacterized protein n=1 Tax=Vairimorpha ceranae TaxID=40302 RepID=A0A0F9WFV5_9MICR|nr:hypothetical protein AAJ76_500052072 [Vairimorpha ceranae]KKO76231.1 hypothetical protein AAJ76_500052072 [Vairimorpha ceranae]